MNNRFLSILLVPAFVPLLFPAFLHAGDQLFADTLQLAEQGDPEAQFSLGLIYDTGREDKRDPERAVYWYSKAAKAGIAGACLYLGMKYEFGTGVQQNRTQAQYWYKQAALKGWPQAAFLLGTLYLHSPQPDPVQGCAWLQIARDSGFPGAEQQWQQQCTLSEKTFSRETAALIKQLRNDMLPVVDSCK